MKKIILILTVAALTFVSCKKETIEPTPVVEPTPTVTSYSIEFLAGDYSGTHYTDIVIKVNGDSIGVLSSATTTMTTGDAADYWDNNGELPVAGALSFNAELNTSYNIEAYTLSGNLIGSTGSKPFILVYDSDFGNRPWLTDDGYIPNDNSSVGADGNDCSFIGADKTLLLIFEIDG